MSCAVASLDFVPPALRPADLDTGRGGIPNFMSGRYNCTSFPERGAKPGALSSLYWQGAVPLKVRGGGASGARGDVEGS